MKRAVVSSYLVVWYRVTFLADHIDTLTQWQHLLITLLKGLGFCHRFTLLKHEMALDFLMAKTGGICVTLNLTGDA